MTEIPVLIVSFDGLRPDLVSPELTPNLHRLQAQGVTLGQHRTIYPTETRTAFPSLVTGAVAGRHGMVGNRYIERSAQSLRSIDTSDAALLRRLDREGGGGVMCAPSLGEILAAAGRSLAVLSTNSPGTTRLFHHKAEDFGHIRLSGHFREACTPDAVLSQAEALFGPLPPEPPTGEPDRAAQDWITSAFLDFLWPKFRPDVTVLSYGEPDCCSHANGTGARKTREAIAYCDRQFGRLLEWWETEGRQAGVQVIALSDHGQITGHTRVSVMDRLREAGFVPGATPAPGVDLVVVPGQVGALYLAEPSEDRVARLVAAITGEPWCGPVFTRPRNEVEGIAPGSLGRHLVFLDHDRAPDVIFAFRADDGLDPFGLVGGTFYDNGGPPGLGLHGGLHPKELAALGILAGSRFPAAGTLSMLPTGICDFAPTILALLGLAVPDSMTGRVLTEVLDPASARGLALSSVGFEASLGGYRQVLRHVRVGAVGYVAGGAVET